jgi:hypothetical protein
VPARTDVLVLLVEGIFGEAAPAAVVVTGSVDLLGFPVAELLAFMGLLFAAFADVRVQ